MSRRPRDSTRKKRRWLPIVIITVAAVVVAGIGLMAWRALSIGQSMMSADNLRTTETVTTSTQRKTISTSGTFAPRNAGYLSFPTEGKVTSVRVKVGDRVTKGEVLAKIDTADLRSAVTVAEAEVEAAQEQLDQAVKDKAGPATLAASRAGVESARQQLRLAEHNLEKTSLKSTLDGVVAAVNIKKGMQSGQGASSTDPGGDSGAEFDPGMGGGMDPGGGGDPGASSLGDTASRAAAADIVVVDPGHWIVDIAISSNDIGQLKKGQPATVTPTGSSKKLPAKVRTIGVIGSSGSGAVTFPATIEIRGKRSGLYIGGTNSVTITVKKLKKVLTVPTVAVEDIDGQTMVTKVVDGTDQQVPVKLGDSFGNRTQILDGLAAGDEIVYYGPPER